MVVSVAAVLVDDAVPVVLGADAIDVTVKVERLAVIVQCGVVGAAIAAATESRNATLDINVGNHQSPEVYPD